MIRLKAIKHIMTVAKHRSIVRRYCFKVGLIRQGLTHDLSKYSWTEFRVGVKYYQGYRSPNAAERSDVGYSAAWLHHKGRNRHHYEYWTDYDYEDASKGYVPIEMPKKYLAEMFFDRIAACKTYKGEKYTSSDPLNYFMTVHDERRMHPETQKQLLILLTMLAERGEDAVLDYIRKEILK